MERDVPIQPRPSLRGMLAGQLEADEDIVQADFRDDWEATGPSEELG